MSEESVNRCLFLLAFPALLAAGPAPLVVGSVRDQYGTAISHARVSAGSTVTETDAQGTFALSEAGVASVAITCDYCKPLTVFVTPGEPVVAFVHRYDAVALDAPSDRDVARVPYAHAESIAALRPFTVLETTSHLLPGPQISDRGAGPRGMLVLDSGIPLYDVATNQSPFVAFPSYSVQRLEWLAPSDAFLYGDLAGGGALLTDTHDGEVAGSLLAAGSSSGFRTGQTTPDDAWSASGSHEQDDVRARADGMLRVPQGDDTYEFNAFAAEDRRTPASQHLDTSVGGARFTYDGARENHVEASLTADAGGYDGATQSLHYSAKWSDVQAQGGVATTTRVQFFTDAAVRASSGDYRTSAPALPLAAGTLAQTHLDAGAQTGGDGYSLRAGIGFFNLYFAGGALGAHNSQSARLLTPGFTGSYAISRNWTYQLQAGESFTLPTVLEAFVYPPDSPALTYDRNAQIVQTLSYGDLRRFRASITQMSEQVTGLDNGTIHSAGVSLAWQMTPALALRAWVLRDNDFTQPGEAIYRFGARPQPATVGSYWLTYESAGLRIDAIYRRDLLDYEPDPHLDASVSAPLAPALRIFGATERRAGIRYVTIGLRTQL